LRFHLKLIAPTTNKMTFLLSLLVKETKGILTEWPWSQTNHNLWEAGFKLETSTSPAFKIEWLKSPTRDRKIFEACLILRELRQGKIRLVERQPDEVEPTWGLSNQNLCPTCHCSSANVQPSSVPTSKTARSSIGAAANPTASTANNGS
jgi:hypothetical protein